MAPDLTTTNILLGVIATVSVMEAVAVLAVLSGALLILHRVKQIVTSIEDRQCRPCDDARQRYIGRREERDRNGQGRNRASGSVGGVAAGDPGSSARSGSPYVVNESHVRAAWPATSRRTRPGRSIA